MAASDTISILGIPMTLSSSMAAQLIGDPEPPTTSSCSTTSIHGLSTELLFNIVDKVESSDLHSLNLTSKTFHNAIQQQRWTHARLVGRPLHMSHMIRHLFQMVQDPNSLVNLTKIKSVSIIILPDPVTQTPYHRMDWAFADGFKYLSFSPPEISSQIVQLLNLLSNKEVLPQLDHITFDPSGLTESQLDKFNELQETHLHPINIASMRIKGDFEDPTYRLIEKCVPTQLHTLHVSHPMTEWPIEGLLSPSHWSNLRKLHFAVEGCTNELDDETEFNAPALEWLSIDGHDAYRAKEYWADELKEQPGNLARKCPKLKRLALTWQGDPLNSDRCHYYLPEEGFLSTARDYFEKNPCLEIMTFRWEFPDLIEVERVDGQEELRLTKRDALEEPREDGWPTICP